MLKQPAMTLAFALAALALCGCEPADQDAELKRQLEAQASARPPRASMSLGYIHSLDDVSEGGPVTVETDEGADIEIEEAYLVVSAIDAHLCEPDVATAGPEEGFWQPLDELFIGRAYAHVPSSATRLGTPFVEDLFAEGRARIVGEIAPPLGQYCSLYAIVSPADDDVLNRSSLDTSEIDGKSLLLRGRWRRQADQPWQPFSTTSRARHPVELDAIDPETGHTPLALNDTNDSKMILLDKTISPTLFDGLEPEHLADSTGADIVLERLENELHIRQFD